MSKVDKLCIRREPPVVETEKMCDQLLLRHLFLSTKTGATYAQGKQTWKRMFVQEVGVVERNKGPLSICSCTIIVARLVSPWQVFSIEGINGQLFQGN